MLFQLFIHHDSYRLITRSDRYKTNNSAPVFIARNKEVSDTRNYAIFKFSLYKY